MKGDYDIMARIYDPALFIPLRSIRIEVARELSEHRESSILDLCCGTGAQLRLLSREGFGNLHGLDLSESMLERVKGYRDPITIYTRDATRTGLDDESFDVVIISFAIHEKGRRIQKAMLREAYRLIGKGGLLLVVDYDLSETPLYAKLAINVVERFAGREHYRNYRNYIKRGGLRSLINGKRFRPVRRVRRLFNGVVIAQYRKSK